MLVIFVASLSLELFVYADYFSSAPGYPLGVTMRPSLL
jgi:hypothetical protein